MPFPSQPFDSESNTGSGTPSSGTLSSGSRSPTENPGNLWLPYIVYRVLDPTELPADAQELFRDIRDIADGVAVVPQNVDESVLLQEGIDFRPFQIRHNGFGQEENILKLRALRDLVRSAEECRIEKESGAAWNNKVHWPLLLLALEGRKKLVRSWNITGARIMSQFVPQDICASSASWEGVPNYGLALECDEDTRAAIANLLAAQPDGLRSLNPTMYQPLRFRPFAVSIVAKAPTPAESGDGQLSGWAQAWMKRMVAIRNPADLSPPLALPLVRVVGHDWLVSWAWLEVASGRNVLVYMGEVRVGDTRTVLGAYKVLTLIQRLAHWATVNFRAWFDDVLTC